MKIVIIYSSPSYLAESMYLFCRTQKYIFWRMKVTKQFQCIFGHILEVNGNPKFLSSVEHKRRYVVYFYLSLSIQWRSMITKIVINILKKMFHRRKPHRFWDIIRVKYPFKHCGHRQIKTIARLWFKYSGAGNRSPGTLPVLQSELTSLTNFTEWYWK